eukprot:366311-Chlamydomonas_euryale.AAC.19
MPAAAPAPVPPFAAPPPPEAPQTSAELGEQQARGPCAVPGFANRAGRAAVQEGAKSFHSAAGS